MRKLWGGRFEAQTDTLIERLNNSLVFDGRLWPYDIEGSIAHAAMLGKTGIIPQDDADLIVEGLQNLGIDLEKGHETLPADAEDVHTAVEGLLRERIGPVAGRLHTARSRNDQIATDIRLYLRAEIDRANAEIRALQEILIEMALQETETVMPGFTHLQHAQPVVLAHHLLAYFWMLDRDRERLIDTRKRVNRLPLGAAALAGTGFPIDRGMVAEALQFDEILENSLDAVADRDFAVEFLSAAAILMMHLSRLAEEIILWNSPEYGWITLDDAVTTGSSIMPQKKNPDVAELVRGKTGRVYGDLTALLVVMKGLPLAYNKDMQEDKEPVFDAVDTLALVLPALRKTVATARFRRERMAAALTGDFSTATDLADYLVRCRLPFREAHDIVGQVVRYCIEHGIGLEQLEGPALAQFSPLLEDDPEAALKLLTPQTSVHSRSSRGGAAPEAVRAQLERARERLAQ